LTSAGRSVIERICHLKAASGTLSRRKIIRIRRLIPVFAFFIFSSAFTQDRFPLDTFADSLPRDWFEVRIPVIRDAGIGHPVEIPITLIGTGEDLLGFDFLIAFDTMRLQSPEVRWKSRADPRDRDLWQFYHHEIGRFEGCDQSCPSGLIRISAANSPDRCSPLSKSGANKIRRILFTLIFQIPFKSALENATLPIKFYWLNCHSNTITYLDMTSSQTGIKSTGVMSALVDYGYSASRDSSLPSHFGISNNCDSLLKNTGSMKRNVLFRNGGVDLAGYLDNQVAGDLNINGLPFEPADLDIFVDYLITHDNSVFSVNRPAQIASTDANKDHAPLTISDLVWISRFISGESPRFPPIYSEKLVTIKKNKGKISLTTPAPLGALYLVLADSTPVASLGSAQDMDIRVGYSNDTTEILCKDSVIKQLAEDDPKIKIFLHQAALTGAFLISLSQDETYLLPDTYNYPLFFKQMFGAPREFNDIEKVVTLRYDVFFENPTSDWWLHIKGSPKTVNWIRSRLGSPAL